MTDWADNLSLKTFNAIPVGGNLIDDYAAALRKTKIDTLREISSLAIHHKNAFWHGHGEGFSAVNRFQNSLHDLIDDLEGK